MKRLLPSVPPDTKITCEGWALTSAPICWRAASTALRATVPNSWRLDALPNRSRRYGSIASSTLSSRGVVAL